MTLAQKLFSFEGRLRRRDWWLLSIGLAIVSFVAGDVLRYALLGPNYSIVTGGWAAWLAMAEPRAGLLNLGVSLLLIWPWAAVYIKRGHDRNLGAVVAIAVLVWSFGYAAALQLFPVPSESDQSMALTFAGLALLNLTISLGTLVVFGFLDGTPGPNRFGPSPKA
ncbi:MAG TPA: DUF805 domain-containing protein [Brevundimonas sp.]|jgi:uncharacterized membrane protein YhaH (DUF805 family)|uniref:DUF805 domain-containing protein n=1 Tax=Brevundimonas sp. TaxID=1871086 RepID=UPI002DF00E9B|nr:DUF805 domain-containing protein [Brevundimonas sp.]